MWIMTPFGVLSIVHRPPKTIDEYDDQVLQVRARDHGTLMRLNEYLDEPRVIRRTPKSDYPFRLYIDQQQLTSILGQMVEELDYVNFKDAAETHRLHDLYIDVWFSIWSAYNRKRKKRWAA